MTAIIKEFDDAQGRGVDYLLHLYMTNLAQRALTGSILVLVISMSVTWGLYSFILLLLAIDILGLHEFYRIFTSEELSPGRGPGMLLSVSGLLTFALTLSGIISGIDGGKILLINIPLAFGIFLSELYGNAKNPIHNLAFTFMGILWITIPLCFFTAIACYPFNGPSGFPVAGPAFFPAGSHSYHNGLILGYFFITWASDTGAYFIGRTLGRHPLFLRISPKKTWEGCLGGGVFALLAGLADAWLFPFPGLLGWMGMAIIISITGVFGDLIKSLMKRSLNLKDSGTLLPGHGGILDRFDSLLGSAPFVYAWLILLPHG